MTDAARWERARELVRHFGHRSDCEMSLADIQWLGANIEKALADAERAGMERAAKVCEAEALIDDDRGYYGKEMAKAIRAKGVG